MNDKHVFQELIILYTKRCRVNGIKLTTITFSKEEDNEEI